MKLITIILFLSILYTFVAAQNCNRCDCTQSNILYTCYCTTERNNCSQEKQNKLPLSTTEIFLDANVDMNKIEEITIHDISIGTLVFTKKLEKLKKLTVKSCNINIIDKNSFYNVNKLTELTIENNDIEILADDAFENVIGLHYLNLRNNSLQKISDKHLKSLTGLLYLNLGMNQIDELNSDLIINNKELQKIYLDKNNLVHLPKDMFEGLTNVAEISLAENKIEELPDGIFSNLITLKKIFLQNNKLTSIVSNIFENCPQLENILLDGNKIKDLDWNIFNYLPHLKFFNIPDSSIKCDCKARQYINTYKDRNISGSIQCSNSKIKKISELTFDDFVCAPKILNCIEGKDGNMTKVSCLINGDPLPETTWRFNGTAVYNNSFFNLKFEAISDDIYWSNLTISSTSINISGLYEIEAQNEGGHKNYKYNLKIAAPEDNNMLQSNYLSTSGIAGISVGIGVLLGVAVGIGSFIVYNKKTGHGHLPVETKMPDKKKKSRSQCYSIDLDDVETGQSLTKPNYVPADEHEKAFLEKQGLLGIQENSDKNRDSYCSTGSNDEQPEHHM